MNVRSLGDRRVRSVKGARLDAPSWGPGGQLAVSRHRRQQTRYEIDGKPVTGTENVFAFRASWASNTEYLYVSDGKIRRRAVAGLPMQTVDFTATMQVIMPEYTHRVRDFTSTTPRKTLGHRAAGDLTRRHADRVCGGRRHLRRCRSTAAPVNLTKDAALDTDPSWSPDGSSLVYSSDRDSPHLQLWVRDMKSGVSRKVTNITTQPQGASFSPDGKRIVFFNVDGMWRVAEMSVLDVDTGRITKIHDSLPQPGTPTWSPDGKRIALAGIAPMTVRFREGTNQVQTISGDRRRREVVRADPDCCRSTRAAAAGRCGRPTARRWRRSTKACLSVWPVARERRAARPAAPRHLRERARAELAGRFAAHPLSVARPARIVDIETGETQDGAVQPDVDAGDPEDARRRPCRQAPRHEVADDAIERRCDRDRQQDHVASCRTPAANHLKAEVVDASNLTVMPGLTEFHSHLQKDYGAAQGRAWLAFGITTVRSPGNTPYEAVEDREANEAGVRPGPRVYGTGYLMEWNRVYYKMGIAISNVSQFEMELQRAKVLEHDLIKSYVRLPDLQQKRMVEFAHSIGVPVATHEIFPASMVGVDNTEHTAATSRRGYSPKQATLQTRLRRRRPAVRQEPAHLLPDDFGRRRARAVRRRIRR